QNVQFAWGNGWDKKAANVGKTQAEPSLVASFPPNNFGLYDMTGNIWEWCMDWYGENYYRESPQHNPTGPTQGQLRVQRGAAYNSLEKFARINFRSRNAPDTRAGMTGFRVVLSAIPATNVN
ncbi:MAG: SUMF1/EgtB/PvdO family nonheme iron enzyme, partial [Acidobacteriota bacterium]